MLESFLDSAKENGPVALLEQRPALTKNDVGASRMANRELCSIDGCGKPRSRRRLCNSHYLRLRRHGSPFGGLRRAAHGEPSAWLRQHVGYSSDKCLAWPFARGRDGRGRIQNDISPQAHRAMCILAHGKPPSARHQAAHTCGKGHEGCVNPAHLYWATPLENNADQIVHGTRLRGAKKPGARLTEDDVRKIRRMKDMGLSQREIGERFGVHAETIGDILRGATWSWLK